MNNFISNNSFDILQKKVRFSKEDDIYYTYTKEDYDRTIDSYTHMIYLNAKEDSIEFKKIMNIYRELNIYKKNEMICHNKNFHKIL